MGGLLAGRYRVEQVRPGESVDSSFVATDLVTRRQVLLVEVTAVAASGWRPAIGLVHPHLAAPLEVVTLPGERGLLVLDWAPGPDLERVLPGGERLAPAVAVDLVLALCGAVAALHARGAVHGLVRPAAVWSVEGRGPVLGVAPAPPSSDPYLRPERAGRAPAREDDLWALASVLHRIAAGAPPPVAGSDPEVERQRLAALGPLGEWLTVALGPVAGRPADAEVFAASLESCRRALAGVPRPAAPRGADPREAAARRDGSSPWFGSWRAVGAVLLFSAIAGGVAALVAGAGPRPTSSSPAPLRAAATPVACSAGIAAASAARPAPSSGADVETGAASRDAGAGGAGADEVSPAEALPSEAEIASCFERQLPEGSLRKPVDLTWLCPTTDPLAGAARLRSAVVAAGAKGPATPAMRIWSRLGPYGMAAFTVVRGACCPEAAPLELPASGRCEPLAPILVELGGATAAGDSIEPIVVRYRDALRCQVAQGQAARLGLKGPPRALHEAAFRSLVEARRVQ